MLDSVTYPIVRRMLGYTNDDFFEKKNPLDPFKVSPHMTLGVQVCLLLSWHEYVQ